MRAISIRVVRILSQIRVISRLALTAPGADARAIVTGRGCSALVFVTVTADRAGELHFPRSMQSFLGSSFRILAAFNAASVVAPTVHSIRTAMAPPSYRSRRVVRPMVWAYQHAVRTVTANSSSRVLKTLRVSGAMLRGWHQSDPEPGGTGKKRTSLPTSRCGTGFPARREPSLRRRADTLHASPDPGEAPHSLWRRDVHCC